MEAEPGLQLYNAAWGDIIEEVRRLLSETVVDVNYQIWNGNTALYIASAWGFRSTNYRQSSFYEIVKLLLENGADVNIANNEGKTPLYIAASWGHTHVVHLLILHGANLNALTKQDKLTALQIASYVARHDDSTIRIGKYGDYKVYSKHHAFYLAVSYMERVMKTGEYLRLLTEIEKDYKKLQAYSATDFLMDIPDGIMEVVAYYNFFATVVELVHAGAKIDIQDADGGTALGKAVVFGHLAIVKLLVENGADPAITNKEGRNVRDIAQFKQQLPIVYFLDKLMLKK